MQCAVCWEVLDPAEPTCTLLGCNHTFHSDCMQRWLVAAGSEPTCPLCRSSSVECEHAASALEHNSNALLGELSRSNARETRALGQRVAALEQYWDARRDFEEYESVRDGLASANERVFTVANPAASDSE